MGYRVTFAWFLSALLLSTWLLEPVVGEDRYLPLVKVAEPLVIPANGSVEGWVELEYWVSTKGEVREIVVKKATNSQLESAAVAIVQNTVHQPYEKDGRILEQHIFQSIYFSSEQQGT